MLAERVKEWTKDWKQQGIEEGRQQGRLEGRQEGRLEGRQEGRQEGEAEFLIHLLERRFGQIGETMRERIEAADTRTLLIWGERILTAQTIEEVFGD